MLNKQEIIEKSDRIYEHLIKLPEYKQAKKIIIYCSKDKEVQTDKIIKYSLLKGKKIIVPISNTEKRILEFSEIKDFDKELKISTFNILEPKSEFIRPFNINNAHIIICPGVGFDKTGGRLGYGFGYFDKALNSVNTNIPFVGLAFEIQIVESLPLAKNDVKMDLIITENGVIYNNYKYKNH